MISYNDQINFIAATPKITEFKRKYYEVQTSALLSFVYYDV